MPWSLPPPDQLLQKPVLDPEHLCIYIAVPIHEARSSFFKDEHELNRGRISFERREYIQNALQNQMKMRKVLNFNKSMFDVLQFFYVAGMMFGAREYAAAPEPQWLHVQVGNNFEQPKWC